MRDLVMQERCDTDARTPFDTATALHFACRVQCSDKAFTIAEILLNRRSKPDCMDHSQCTPLIIASEMGHLHLVSLLLSLGASTHRHAHCEEFPRGVRWSLDHMSLTQRDKDEMCDPFMGNNALHQACREHKVSVVAELLRHGCDKDARNSQGNTALHIACKSESKTVYSDNPTRGPVSGSCKIVRLLIDRGYDLNALNKHTDTPVIAGINGIYEVVQWDLTRDKKQAEILNFLQITEKMIQAGCDMCVQTPEGANILYLLVGTCRAISGLDPTLYGALTHTCHMTILAGCPVTHSVIQQSINMPDILLQLLLDFVNKPRTLKHLALLTVRNSMHKPLWKYMPSLNLPKLLMKNALLEILD